MIVFYWNFDGVFGGDDVFEFIGGEVGDVMVFG